jgi:CubicO group peptidase (beta-lactamase class C family)
MTFLFRSLMIIVAAAFMFATANLFVSGVPDTDDISFELASDLQAPSPGVMRDMVSSLFGAEPAAPAPILIAAVATPDAPEAIPSTLTTDIEAEWRAWMAANSLTEGAMVVMLPDGTMHRTGLDRATDAVASVASLSKAITGICMDIVLQEQGLSWYTRLADIAPQMSAVRVTPQRWNDHITLAQLANHTSGLAPDLTQGTMGSSLHGALGLHRRIASEALREENMQGRSREFFYNNTNYAVLGVAIEALTGQSYAQACMDRVVVPAGVTDAVIQGAMGSRSSYGGWEMSAESYARVAQHWLTAGNERIDRPAERPMNNYYSLGYYIHGDGEQAQVSHAGRYCHPNGRNQGAYMHTRGDGTVFTANWSGRCVSASDTGLGGTIAGLMR